MRRELMTGCTVRRYDQLETSPETIEQELRPAVCERRQTDRLMENYCIDVCIIKGIHVLATSLRYTSRIRKHWCSLLYINS